MITTFELHFTLLSSEFRIVRKSAFALQHKKEMDIEHISLLIKHLQNFFKENILNSAFFTSTFVYFQCCVLLADVDQCNGMKSEAGA